MLYNIFSVIWVSLCYNFFCGPDGLYWSQLFIIYTGGRHQGILLYLCRHALNLLANLEIKNLLGRPWLCSLHGPCRAPSTTTRHYIHYITDHQQKEIHSSSFGLMQTKTTIKLTFIKIDSFGTNLAGSNIESLTRITNVKAMELNRHNEVLNHNKIITTSDRAAMYRPWQARINQQYLTVYNLKGSA